ncbi:MAG: hypothetical protein PGN07_01945 [Aeromicrobium erythreum]
MSVPSQEPLAPDAPTTDPDDVPELPEDPDQQRPPVVPSAAPTRP